MAPRYQSILESLRTAFPQPVSDPVHDGYVVFSLLRTLDRVDALKSQAPILGSPTEPDYTAARAARIADQGQTLEAVIPQLVHYLEGMLIWGHPRSQINVVPNPTLASIVGVLLPVLYNPNLVSEESGRLFSEAEVRVATMVAELVGYDPSAARGVFTFGGTGTLLYGAKIGLEKALPHSGERGVGQDAVILASDQSHYSCLTVANWLGIGQRQVIAVPSDRASAIRVDALEEAARRELEAGRAVVAMVATMGTTDAFGIDDLAAIHDLRERLVADYRLDYSPHLHADAVIGWAWSMFNDYPFAENPLGFRDRTVRALAAAQERLAALRLADSIGIDFHKTGYTPYISSLLLVRDGRDFDRLARPRETMPYLYQSGEYHPGIFTLETTRSGFGPMAAMANLLHLGKTGYQSLLGHAVEMAETLRELIEAQPQVTVLNDQNVGPVTLFRAYPDDVAMTSIVERELSDPACQAEVRAHNEYNRRIFDRVHADALQGRGVALSLTDCYRRSVTGEPIAALKSYVLSPFSDAGRMASILRHVWSARDAVRAEWKSENSKY